MASSKLLKASQGSDIEHKGDMSSMIDMVFLLLIFFMVSANFVKLKLDPRVDVPEADEAREDPEYLGRIVLNILNDEETEKAGGYRWADEDYNTLAKSEITEYVANSISELDSGVPAKLHVRPDASVEMRHVKEAVAAATSGNAVFSVIIATKTN